MALRAEVDRLSTCVGGCGKTVTEPACPRCLLTAVGQKGLERGATVAGTAILKRLSEAWAKRGEVPGGGKRYEPEE